MERLIENILKAAEKHGNAEILVGKQTATDVMFEKNSLSGLNTGTISELQIRLSKGKKFGFSKTNDLNAWESCLKNAVSVLKASMPLESEITIQGKKKYPRAELYAKKLDYLAEEQLLSSASGLVEAARNTDKRIHVTQADVGLTKGETIFANSLGVEATETIGMLTASAETTVGEVTGSEMRASRDFFDATDVGKTAAELCLTSLEPKQLKTGKVDLLLDYFAFADIVETVLVPAFSAENVQAKRSVLAGKLGEQVFSEHISIEDNSLLRLGLGSRLFDLEGVPGQKTKLVERGVLKDYIYDRYSAAKAGKESTGNCAGLMKIPLVGPTNFVISPGAYSREDMLKETKNGVLAKYAFGTHVANVLTGDISIGVLNAFYVKNGAIEHPTKQAMVSFNLFDALKHVVLVGKDLRQETSVSAPLVRLENVQIIG